MAGEVALETADRLAHALALASAPFDVGDRLGVALAPGDDDRVQGTVELAIAAGVEAVAQRLTRGGGDGSAGAQAGEGRLAGEAPLVRVGDEELRGRDRADADLLEELGRQLPDESVNLTLEQALLLAQGLNTPRERAQR